MLITVITMVVSQVFAFHSGSTPDSCDTMLPNHGIRVQPIENGPYNIWVSKKNYAPGEPLSVYLHGVNNEPFRGYLIQARDEQGRRAGSFHISQNCEGKILFCDTSGIPSSVTHNSPLIKHGILLKWIAPIPPVGNVTFLATVVVSKDVFYVPIQSAMIQGYFWTQKSKQEQVINDSSLSLPEVWTIVVLVSLSYRLHSMFCV